MSICAIIHPGRTGSTFLCQQLNSQRAICSAGEIFNSNHNLFPDFFGQSWDRYFDNPIRYVEFMYHAQCNSMSNKFQHYVFEYKESLLKYPIEEFISKSNENIGCIFVFLYRKNYLRRLISLLVALQTSVWHVNESAPKPVNPVYVDLNSITDEDVGVVNRSLIEAIEQYQQFCKNLIRLISSYRHLVLTYEDDILENPMQGFQKVCQFLTYAIDCVPSAKVARQNPFPLDALILNYGDVYHYLDRYGMTNLLTA